MIPNSRARSDPGVLPWELPLPGVGLGVGVLGVLVTPGEGLALEPTAGSELPLGFAGQAGASPGAVGDGIVVVHVDHRMIGQRPASCRPQRMPPVGPRCPGPPLGIVAQIDRAVGELEHQRARHQVSGRGARVEARIGCLLGLGDPPGRGDEASELLVGHRVAIHPEPVDRDPADRPLLRVEVVGPHREHPRIDADHATLCGHLGTRHLRLASSNLTRAAVSMPATEVQGRGPVSELLLMVGRARQQPGISETTARQRRPPALPELPDGTCDISAFDETLDGETST